VIIDSFELWSMAVKGKRITAKEGVFLQEDWDGKTNTDHYQFPDICQLEKGEVFEKEFLMQDATFSGTGRELAVKDIHIWYQSIEFLQRRTWLLENKFPRVQMNFNLQGLTSYYSDKLGQVFVRFKTGQYNLMLIPEGKTQMQWSAGERTEIFSLSLSTDFFFDILPPSQRLCQHFQMGIDHQLPAFMSLRNLPITGQMAHILFEILNCEYKDHHKSLFVKAKTIELLILLIEHYEHLPLPDFSSGLSSEHAEKMHLVKRMLDENMDQQWSLKDLAHRVGTNEYNLKKYFRELFGKTVFGYLHEVRMKASKDELCQPGSSVNEVAQRMGYKHPTHFTAAFKKYYGILPTKLRMGL